MRRANWHDFFAEETNSLCAGPRRLAVPDRGVHVLGGEIQLSGAGFEVLHVEHRLLGIDDLVIDDGVDRGGDVVGGDDLLLEQLAVADAREERIRRVQEDVGPDEVRQLVDGVRARFEQRVTEEIVTALRSLVGDMRRRGAVVAVSGGIDSSVCCALAARAFGPQRTLALLMPEADSDDETLAISRSVTDAVGADVVVEEIVPVLSALGCYERRDAAVREVVPQFTDGWKFKIVLPSVLGTDSYRLFSLIAQSPAGETVGFWACTERARLCSDGS